MGTRIAVLAPIAGLFLWASIPTVAAAQPVGTSTAPLSSASVSTPVSGNATWTWENPLPQGNPLNSVSCPSTTTCYALGGGRTIIATTNAGASWLGHTLDINPNRSLYAISCPSVSTCFAVTVWAGGAGVYGTADGGLTWSPQTPLLFQSISCGSTSSCVALPDGVTTDGGAHWTTSSMGNTPGPVIAVSCAPGTTACVAVGYGGSVDTSTDGGMHWTTQNSGYIYTLKGVSCADAQHCVAVGYNTVLSTANGGASWSTTMVTGDLLSVSCSLATKCTATGQNGAIFSTTDGLAWSPQGSITQRLVSVSCSSPSTCVAVGDTGTIVSTTDAGSHWSYQSSSVGDPTLYLSAVSCSSPHFCVTAGEPGASPPGITSILTTTDGTSWSAKSLGARIEPHGLSCQSPTFCVGVGVDVANNFGAVFKTTDGVTWSAQDQGPAGLNLRGVSCPVAGTCFAAGTGGILATNDGGATWATQNATSLNAISCPSATACVAVGYSGVILAMVDGHTWSRQTSPISPTVSFVGVSCPSTSVCYAAAYQGDVIDTVDGGLTWIRENVYTDGASGISCADARNCVIFHGSFVYVTVDAGASWSQEWPGAQPGGQLTNTFSSVSCSLTSCIGVGGFDSILLRATASGVTAKPGFVAADGTSPSTVTVTLRTALGEPLAGKSVSLAQNTGHAPASITPASVVSDAAGQAVFSVTSNATGTDTFKATNTTDAAPIAQAATVTFVANPFSATTTAQYWLRSSDGATWRDIDPANLSVRLTPTVDSMALIGGNIDLWTANAGYNQDVGVFVSGGTGVGTTYPTVVGQPEAWKESGGYAGTYSPNAAFVQAALPMKAGNTYTISLQWKTNKPAVGATIYAGAGPIGVDFSPSRLTAQLIPTSSSNLAYARDRGQHMLAGSDGSAWKDIDPSLSLRYTAPADGVAIIGGNADLWTINAGYNQDIGISVVDVNALPCTGGLGLPCQPVAWKESGGFAGTYSPNAAFVQTTFAMSAGHTYQITLQWKANKPSANATIVVGGGPINSDYSPTLLSLQFVLSGTVVLQATSTDQFALSSSDGVAWQPLGPFGTIGLTLPTPAKNCQALISGNADLWTANAGFNQDLGIAVDGAIVAWKESGGFAGTFSPNAAYLQTVIPLTAGTASSLQLEWKTNRPATGATIYAGAGPIGTNYSPTQLIAQLAGCS